MFGTRRLDIDAPGLTNTAAADTAWVIASPDSHDQLENWGRTTLTAALLPDKQ
jgi:hypothetical protein